nr:universal stress protein [Neobacillus sp. Marseille-Q6967]
MEKIVVCISNPNHAEKLIQRGKLLANAFQGECLILNVLSEPYDELDFNQLQMKLMFEKLEEKYEVQIISEPSSFKKVSHHIAKFAETNQATQIVIGQVTQNKLELALKESLINSLLAKLEGIDIHIVEVSRDDENGEEYQRGIPADIIKENDEFHISFTNDDKQALQKGIFYKTTSSDFPNGFFVIKKEKEHQVLKVLNGKIKEEDINQLNL